MADPSLVSIQVGRPRRMGRDGAADTFDRPWTSGIFKAIVSGPVFVGLTNLAGDDQADRQVHGGPDKAVCVYSADHYAYWRATLGLSPFDYGAFGENFTIEGLTEDDVCIGDLWSVGSVLVQVSQPRQPCWKLGRKWRITNLPEQVVAEGRTGWYFRVLREGEVDFGAPLALAGRSHPEWTIAAANGVMHHRKDDFAAAAALSAVAPLSRSWRESLAKRATMAGT